MRRSGNLTSAIAKSANGSNINISPASEDGIGSNITILSKGTPGELLTILAFVIDCPASATWGIDVSIFPMVKFAPDIAMLRPLV
ncbi:hypothetical protein, partial [Moorena sp. SIO3I8]|uniref:hypothetical protein n=1 Tax=Moorena sp. SIO3I8 TaxID=2607833 RepID=UPI0013BFE725